MANGITQQLYGGYSRRPVFTNLSRGLDKWYESSEEQKRHDRAIAERKRQETRADQSKAAQGLAMNAMLKGRRDGLSVQQQYPSIFSEGMSKIAKKVDGLPMKEGQDMPTGEQVGFAIIEEADKYSKATGIPRDMLIGAWADALKLSLEEEQGAREYALKQDELRVKKHDIDETTKRQGMINDSAMSRLDKEIAYKKGKDAQQYDIDVLQTILETNKKGSESLMGDGGGTDYATNLTVAKGVIPNRDWSTFDKALSAKNEKKVQNEALDSAEFSKNVQDGQPFFDSRTGALVDPKNKKSVTDAIAANVQSGKWSSSTGNTVLQSLSKPKVEEKTSSPVLRQVQDGLSPRNNIEKKEPERQKEQSQTNVDKHHQGTLGQSISEMTNPFLDRLVARYKRKRHNPGYETLAEILKDNR